jgi:Flp pilus assembly protein TadD
LEQSDTATRGDKMPPQQSNSVAEPGSTKDPAGTGAAFFSRGVAALQAKRAAEAVDLLKKAISVRRARPIYHFKLGQALQAAGRLDEAAEA